VTGDGDELRKMKIVIQESKVSWSFIDEDGPTEVVSLVLSSVNRYDNNYLSFNVH